jgi:hypothetical protein
LIPGLATFFVRLLREGQVGARLDRFIMLMFIMKEILVFLRVNRDSQLAHGLEEESMLLP